MVLEKLTQETLKAGVYYSRWHSVGKKIDAEWVSYYDLVIGELVGPILDAGKDSFIVTTFLTDLIDLDDSIADTTNPLFKMWEKDAGTMYLEHKDSGIRYNGYYESFKDNGEDGLFVLGGYCIFTQSLEDAHTESFFRLRDLLLKENEEGSKDYENILSYLKLVEPFIRELVPEKFI